MSIIKDSQNVGNLHDAPGDDRYAFGVETVHPDPRRNRQMFVAPGQRNLDASLHRRQNLEFVLNGQG